MGGRPGRLEVQIEIGLPDEAGRVKILQIHSNKMRENSFLANDVDLPNLGTPPPPVNHPQVILGSPSEPHPPCPPPPSQPHQEL